MVFSSTVFLFVFLPLVLAGYYLLNPKYRNIFLLITSLLFYAWGEPKFVFIMIGSIFMNYIYALLVDKVRSNKVWSKIIISLMFFSNLGIFWVFKYSGFTMYNVNKLFGTEFVVSNIALPIGISFFTFQGISYVLDVYWKKGEVQKNPLNVGLYIALFPQLIAGPIVRYETVAKEIISRRENWQEICEGLERFIYGLGKKILISNALAIVADRCFTNIANPDISVLMAWIGAICYSFQIYFDFSGYSDMAIGLGKMFGFHFDENFNYPYIANSITDFWRRWHISLSSWFRDYVYIPLGGSRVKKSRLLLNLFVVWTLTGVWHGASWNFICWGWFYYILLVFEKMTNIPKRLNSKIGKIIYRIITLLCVNFGWVLFRAENLSVAVLYIKKMFGLCGNALFDVKAGYILWDNKWVLLFAVLCSTPLLKKLDDKKTKQNILYEIVKSVFMLIVLIISICSVISSSYNPFIYFNF